LAAFIAEVLPSPSCEDEPLPSVPPRPVEA
jgi:hypothetical protein